MMMMMMAKSLFAILALVGRTSAFQTAQPNMTPLRTAPSYSTALHMANDEDFMRWAKSSRSAQADDTVVELMKPLGLVLNADDEGNVYVETVAPKGNAARTGKVKEGDIVTMVSATFGNDLWTVRGVGLTRVLAAIRVRSGNTVKLVLESPTKSKQRKKDTTKQLQAREEAAKSAQAKKDSLLKTLEEDEQRLKKGKFLGLF